MSIMELGALGELVGAIAVVATLGYLAVQIRHSTVVARSAVRQGIAQMTVGQVADMVADRDVARLWLESALGNPVDAIDQLRIQARCYLETRRFENIHYQYLAGLLTETEWRGLRENLKDVLTLDMYRESWDAERDWYPEAFRAEVDGLLRELELAPERMGTLKARLRSFGPDRR